METIKKAQQMGTKVKELQEELVETEIEAESANGAVTVVVSGAQVPISVTVTDELLAKGAAAVSEAVTEATKEAHLNSQEYAKDRMTAMYAEIGLPLPPNAGPTGA
jgi:DNA-binding YbaB/EbfC family protein